MLPSLEKLRKFFRLEHENKYENTAIIGGLAKMLDYWEAEARADGVTEEVIQAVIARLRSYEGLKPEGRVDALKGLWKRIQNQYPDDQQKTAQKPRPPQQPKPQQPKSEGDRPAPQEARSQETRSQQPRQRPPAQPRSESVPGAKHSQTPAALDAPLTVLQGVGPKHAQTLAELGMSTLGDMLYYFPRRYEDYSQLKPIKSLWYGEQVTVIGTVTSVHTRPIRGGKASIVEVIISDTTGALRLSWFNNPRRSRKNGCAI